VAAVVVSCPALLLTGAGAADGIIPLDKYSSADYVATFVGL